MSLLDFIPIRFIDIVDIILVTLLVYQFLKFIKGTRATPILVGLVIFFAISFVARWLDLKGISWIMNSILTVWVIAFVIVFQPEIRNALARMGKTRLSRYFLRIETAPVIEEVVEAIKDMSRDKVGALIVFERAIGLKDIIETGTKVEGRVSRSLLKTIFFPDPPLHDGACIIRMDQLVSAACILPLSENPDLGGRFGLRHRAAVGISEISDAVAIIVSEETGKIALALSGRLMYNLDLATLKKNLEPILVLA